MYFFKNDARTCANKLNDAQTLAWLQGAIEVRAKGTTSDLHGCGCPEGQSRSVQNIVSGVAASATCGQPGLLAEQPITQFYSELLFAKANTSGGINLSCLRKEKPLQTTTVNQIQKHVMLLLFYNENLKQARILALPSRDGQPSCMLGAAAASNFLLSHW